MPSKSLPAERPLALPDADIASIVKRLRRAEGQLAGIRAMLERRADCHGIVQQMSAARGAVDRAMVAVIVGSLADCLRSTDGDEAKVAAIAESFARVL